VLVYQVLVTVTFRERNGEFGHQVSRGDAGRNDKRKMFRALFDTYFSQLRFLI
jgi:hypothetical protein